MGLAAVLLVFVLLVVALEFQSPDIVLWTGHRAVGTQQGGLVIFEWHGQAYSAQGPVAAGATRVTVYFDPGDPAKAMVDNVADRVITGLLVGVPLVAAVAVLVAGPTRRRWRELRRDRMVAPGFGQGLDPEFVDRVLRERRSGPG